MSKNWFNNILICPACHKSLEFDKTANLLRCVPCGNVYKILDNIPILLEETKNNELISEFNYIEHYKTDSEEFDYFDERTGATKDDERRVYEYILNNTSKNLKKERKNVKLNEKVDTILDVGCGRAWVAGHFINKGKKVVSLDISKTNVLKALQNFPSENHYGIVADAYHLPFPDNCFDLIIASEIIEHVISPELFVRELFRCVAKGGSLIITTPYKEKLTYSLCIHCNKPTPKNAHIHSFDENILLGLNKSPDLKNSKWKTFGNKVLLHLRTYILLKYLPFGLWRVIDNLFNLIVNKEAHIIVRFEKFPNP